jgi:glycosyltransferase involved in cell wall biosynthesis
MIPLGVRRADAVVTVSEFSKEKIVESLPVDEKNVHVIYNGVDSIFFNQNAGVPVDLPEEYILFVGSADKRKNLKRLIEAYESIEDSIELVVVGPQNDLAYGGEGINRDNLLNLGYVTQEELRYIYENATLFAYPSLYEGFGLPPVEAAACGTPVMTSNLTAMPEVMGNAAEFVDPYDVESIRQGLDVINDPERLQELSELGRKQAKKYTWKKSTDRLIKIFNKMS